MIGLDCGTFNLVCSTRDELTGDFKYKREVNAFLEVPLDDRFTFNMMKNSKVPLIERKDGKVAYACGEAAVRMAYSMSKLELKRPMCNGCVNPKEKDSFQIMSIMMHSLIGNVKRDKELLYYSVPANAINKETDADYHSKILEAILKAYKSKEGFTVDPQPINEALALVYAELAEKNYTGIGISCGAGMVNVCFAMFGSPVFSFAIVNSGDWIDAMSAKATGETIAYINKQKTKIDLKAPPTNLVERAIQTQYKLMIDHTVAEIKKGLNGLEDNVRIEDPVDFVVAGGTSSPNGFVELFKEGLKEAQLSIPYGDIIRPSEPLYSVAKGCLIAAEAATKS